MINKFIDHTILKNTTSDAEIIQLCQEAITYKFKAVCVPPIFVEMVSKLLQDTDIRICTVVGFPFGYHTTETKIFEAVQAAKQGALEIDLVININKLKSGDQNYLINEINGVKKAIKNRILKVIVETSVLTLAEKKLVMEIINKTNADYIKTSTGFSGKGADLDDIMLFKKMARPNLKIKASGGIKTFIEAETFLKAGANRIGTSRGVEITNEYLNFKRTGIKKLDL